MPTVKEIKNALIEKGHKTTEFVGKSKEELENMLIDEKEVTMAEVEPLVEVIEYPKAKEVVKEKVNTEYVIVNKEGVLIKKTNDKEWADKFIAAAPEKRFLK